MTRFTATMPTEYFEDLYKTRADPWGFATSEYERDKYAATLAALSAPRYRHALEVGCSVGVLTRLLSERCDWITAVDASSTALQAARQRCADVSNIEFARMAVPGAFPGGTFDLILLSEVLYYLDRGDLAVLAERCAVALAPAGEVVLVHWTGPTNYPLTGDEAAEAFIEAMPPTIRVRSRQRHPRYRLDVAGRDGCVT